MYSKHQIDEEAEREAKYIRVMKQHEDKPRKSRRREYVRLSSEQQFELLLNQEISNERENV